MVRLLTDAAREEIGMQTSNRLFDDLAQRVAERRQVVTQQVDAGFGRLGLVLLQELGARGLTEGARGFRLDKEAVARVRELHEQARVLGAYAGDDGGNLWRFDLLDTNSANWGITFNKPLFTTDANQPIYVAKMAVSIGKFLYEIEKQD